MKLVYILVGGVIGAGGFAASGLGLQTDAQGAATPAAVAQEANAATIPDLPPLPAGHPAMDGE